MLRNELEMVPRRFALALEFRDVRRQLVEVNFRGSRYRADLKAESRKKHLRIIERKNTRAAGFAVMTGDCGKKSSSTERTVDRINRGVEREGISRTI